MQSTDPISNSQSKPSQNAEESNDPLHLSAVSFLKDSRVRHATVENKIQFLKEKGLSSEQIKRAFEEVGQPITLDKISSAEKQKRTPSPPQVQQVQQARNPYRSNTSPTHTLFPQQPLVPPPEEKGIDWRDVVIGTGAAVLTAIGGAKLFQKYSPYEIRRKGNSSEQARLQSRRRRVAETLSDSETDRMPYRSRAPAPPTLPLPDAPAAAKQPAAVSTEATEELEKLKKELADAKAALDNERKRSGELSISLAKVRQEKQQLFHKNEKLTRQVEELEEQQQKKEEEANAAATDGSVDGSPITSVPPVDTPTLAPMESPVTPAFDAPASDIPPVTEGTAAPASDTAPAIAPAMPLTNELPAQQQAEQIASVSSTPEILA